MGFFDAIKKMFGGGQSEPAPAPAVEPVPTEKPAPVEEPAPVVEPAPVEEEAPAEVPAPSPDDAMIAALNSLKEALAKGEITEGQFKEKKTVLLKRI